jgi:putative endonuclease
MSQENYYVYILTNSRNTVLYIGVTNDLARRISEHKLKLIKGFTSKYNVDKLVYYETFSDPSQVIHREKELKGWLRSKKILLINSINPSFKDLSLGWE